MKNETINDATIPSYFLIYKVFCSVVLCLYLLTSLCYNFSKHNSKDIEIKSKWIISFPYLLIFLYICSNITLFTTKFIHGVFLILHLSSTWVLLPWLNAQILLAIKNKINLNLYENLSTQKIGIPRSAVDIYHFWDVEAKDQSYVVSCKITCLTYFLKAFKLIILLQTIFIIYVTGAMGFKIETEELSVLTFENKRTTKRAILNSILSHSAARSLLLNNLIAELHVEILIFIDYVNLFETLSGTQAKLISEYIVETFIDRSAPFCMNLNYAVGQTIQKKFKSGEISKDLFTEAKEEMMKLIVLNLMPRFMRTEAYSAICIKDIY
eukprot:snap_masked-scaffold_2-processed-gene-18.50-mRNA-1 protein AED:1.00 eAED:1.00 QI:0/0/0/0/1/1/3/0/323